MNESLKHLLTCAPDNRRARSDSGNATMELALVLPLTVLILMGAMDFGRVFYTAIILTNAARAGAQFASMSAANSSDVGRIRQAAQEEAQDLPGGISVDVERLCTCPGGATVDCVSGSCGSYGSPRIHVKVRTQKTFDTLFTYPGLPHTVALRKEAIFRAQ